MPSALDVWLGEWPRRWTCGWGSALGPGRVAGGVPSALDVWLGECPRPWTCGWGSALGAGRVAGKVAELAALEKTWGGCARWGGAPETEAREAAGIAEPRSDVILGEFPLGAPRGAPRICDERCCAHSVIVEDCRWGWQNNKNDSDNNNGNDDDSINNTSKQKQQQLRIHVRRIPLGGFPLLPFNPALGERPRVPRRGHPAVLSASESLLAEASRWKPVG